MGCALGAAGEKLAGEYERIYYIDTITDYYLVFGLGPEGELRILPGGEDFFSDLTKDLLAPAAEADRSRLEKALSPRIAATNAAQVEK